MRISLASATQRTCFALVIARVVIYPFPEIVIVLSDVCTCAFDCHWNSILGAIMYRVSEKLRDEHTFANLCFIKEKEKICKTELFLPLDVTIGEKVNNSH